MSDVSGVTHSAPRPKPEHKEPPRRTEEEREPPRRSDDSQRGKNVDVVA